MATQQTAQRPSLAKKTTRSSEAKRKEALDQGVKIIVDDREYVVRVGEITAQISRRFRREVGISFRSVLDELTDDPDIDSIAAIVWLARLLEGENVSLDEIELDYSDLDNIDVAESGPAEGDGDSKDPED